MSSQKECKPRRRRRVMRALRWLALLPLASRAPTYGRLILALSLDPRVPASRKAVLGLAAGYLILGRDLVPDDIPFLGAIDDLAVVVLAVEVFLDAVPMDVLDEKLDDLDIDPEAFHRDMVEVRRLTPAPVRALALRLPDALEATGRLVVEADLGRRLHEIASREFSSSKEESFA